MIYTAKAAIKSKKTFRSGMVRTIPIACGRWTALAFFFAISTLGASYADARIWYVDVDSPAASPDGSSWETAFTSIQHAVRAAVEQRASETEPAEVIEPAEIWVAKGVYAGKKAMSSELGELVLFMHPYVHLYGGFSGNETARAQRNWELNKTIIDGENKRRCVSGAANSTLDGFTITHGNAIDNYGGGLYNIHPSMQIKNCLFVSNKADGDGGGIYNQAASLTIMNCTFVENTAGVDGGGLFLGKAMGCTFRGNIAKRNGGGLCNGVATNCVFIDNTAHKNGGGMCWSGAVNSTFFGNTAQGNGGGVYDRYSVFLTNCIVWGNSAEKEGQAIYPVHAEAPRVTYSCIEGGYTGEGNIDTPPLFVNPDEGDVALQTGSPCIDAGTSKDLPTTDIQGTSRPQGNGVDMGAYEWSGDKTK